MDCSTRCVHFVLHLKTAIVEIQPPGFRSVHGAFSSRNSEECGLRRRIMFCLWLDYRYRLRQVTRRSNELLLERVAERERIAQDLHDTFLQSIQGLMLKFQMATGQLRPEIGRAHV